MFQNDILINCLKRVVTKLRVLYLETPPTKKRIYVYIFDIIEFTHLMSCVFL